MFRLYLLIWALFLLVVFAEQYREILTYLGVDYWTEAAYVERKTNEMTELGCLDPERLKTIEQERISRNRKEGRPDDFINLEDIMCMSASNPPIWTPIPNYGLVRNEEKNDANVTDMFYLFVLLPAVLLIFGYALWNGVAWALKGFRQDD